MRISTELWSRQAPLARPVTGPPAIELTPQIGPTTHHFSFRCSIASFFQRGIAAIAGSEAGTAVVIGTFARPVNQALRRCVNWGL